MQQHEPTAWVEGNEPLVGWAAPSGEYLKRALEEQRKAMADDFNFETFRRPTRRLPPEVAAQLPPVVSIQRPGTIYLSRRVLTMLQSSVAAHLLFDKAQRVIGIRPAPQTDLTAYRLGGPPDRSSAYICALAFLDHYAIDHAETRQYACEMRNDVLCVFLNERR